MNELSTRQMQIVRAKYKIKRAIRKLAGRKELTDEQISILKAKIEELVIKS